MQAPEAPAQPVSLKRPSFGDLVFGTALSLGMVVAAGVVTTYVAALLVVKVGVGGSNLVAGGPFCVMVLFAWVLSLTGASLGERLMAIGVGAALGIGLLVGVDPSLTPCLDIAGHMTRIPSIGYVAASSAAIAGFVVAGCTLYQTLKQRWESPPPELPTLTLRR